MSSWCKRVEPTLSCRIINWLMFLVSQVLPCGGAIFFVFGACFDLAKQSPASYKVQDPLKLICWLNSVLLSSAIVCHFHFLSCVLIQFVNSILVIFLNGVEVHAN